LTSSTTLQNDDALIISLGANDAVEFSGMMFATSTSATPDLKVAFTVPTGATIRWFGEWFGESYVSSGLITASGTASPVFPIAANGVGLFKFNGIVTNGSTAGNLQFQWAQNTSNSNAVTVQQRSFLIGSKF
ncbi:MAG: hypothetical protein ACKO3W_16060, partial [bacterium]